MVGEHIHDDAAALVDALAETVRHALTAALAERGQALLALAGGGTPLPVYERLAALPLPWQQVTVVATDERWVDADHPARNERAIAQAFAAAPALRILPLVPPRATHPPLLATARQSLSGLAAFDVVLLGMGDDAHTASLFPGADGLAAALDPDGAEDACVLLPQPLPAQAPYPRVSLTAARLLRSRRLLLAIRGDGKRRAWLAAGADPDPLRSPIGLFARQQRVPFDMHWSP